MKCKSLLLRASVASALLLTGAAYAGELTIFTQPNFNGGQLTLSGEARNLDRSGFNDRAASVIVRSGRWEVCTDANFSGNCAVLAPGDYPALRGDLYRQISSAREVGPVAYAPEVLPAPAYPIARGEYYEPPRYEPYSEVNHGRYSALELYTLPGFRGSTMKFDNNATTLDKRVTDEGVSSLVVREGVWQLCTGLDFNGRCRTFEPGRYPRLGSFEGAGIGSLRRVG
jgi:hypothetical protein